MINPDNHELQLAQHFIHYTGMNLFLTGKAGTGKTTFLRNLKKHSPKRMVVLAPTGVAAINAGGSTIHSFFQLPFSPYIPDLGHNDTQGAQNKFNKNKIDIIKSLDLLVIDEISMVRADLLDAIDDVLKRLRRSHRPFGGVQLLLIGDVQQLAPVIRDDEWNMLRSYYDSPYFFNSKALNEAHYVTIELEKIYRQSDATFVNILNSIRENNITDVILSALNERFVPDFVPKDSEEYITLTTHNSQANQINERKLATIKSEPFIYKASKEGNFPEYMYPTEERLVLKKGAQVMFVKNDSSPEKKYYNGKIGTITAISQSYIKVECDDAIITVEPQEWLNAKYKLDEKSKEIVEVVEGRFLQFPLKTAWAITIHKSQGLTFDRAIINASAAFTHGQVYVALSRCRTLEGLVLTNPIPRDVIKHDPAVVGFNQYVSKNKPTKENLEVAQGNYFLELVSEMIGFKSIIFRMSHICRLLQEHLSKIYPQMINQLEDNLRSIEIDIIQVSERFKYQLATLIQEWKEPEENEVIQDRVKKSAAYYIKKMDELIKPILEHGAPTTDNKELASTLEKEFEILAVAMAIKYNTFEAALDGFFIEKYLSIKAKTAITPLKKKPAAAKKETALPDIKYPALYNRLREWRKGQADEYNLPVYTILQQKALIGIVNKLPANKKDLLAIPGVGKKIVEKFGPAIIEMVDEFRVDMGTLLDM